MTGGIDLVCPECGHEDDYAGQPIGMMGMPVCPKCPGTIHMKRPTADTDTATEGDDA